MSLDFNASVLCLLWTVAALCGRVFAWFSMHHGSPLVVQARVRVSFRRELMVWCALFPCVIYQPNFFVALSFLLLLKWYSTRWSYWVPQSAMVFLAAATAWMWCVQGLSSSPALWVGLLIFALFRSFFQVRLIDLWASLLLAHVALLGFIQEGESLWWLGCVYGLGAVLLDLRSDHLTLRAVDLKDSPWASYVFWWVYVSVVLSLGWDVLHLVAEDLFSFSWLYFVSFFVVQWKLYQRISQNFYCANQNEVSHVANT